MNDTQLFAFESDFVSTLRCVPMAVRFKLDRCGIKLSLRQWSQFTLDDRQALLVRRCDDAGEVEAYRAALTALVALRTGEAAKPLAETPCGQWDVADQVAPVVRRYARSLGVQPPSQKQWRALTVLQRFVLIKLTRDNHDNVNFVPALCEFGLADQPCGAWDAGGRGGIRTHGGLPPTAVFKTAALNHSATRPGGGV